MKRKILWGLLASLILIGIMVAGCRSGSNGGSQTPGAPAAPAQSLGQGAAQTGGAVQWPSQMPPDVPRFNYGTIIYSSNNVFGGNMQAVFINATQDSFSKYQSDLKNEGWTVSSDNSTEVEAYKGRREVLSMFINTADSGLRVTVTYYPRNK